MIYPTYDQLRDAGYTPEPLYIPRYYEPGTPIALAPLATDRSQAHRPLKVKFTKAIKGRRVS